MTEPLKKKSLRELAKEKQGRLILLGVIALASMYMWSGILFGKKKSSRPAAPATAASTQGAPAATTPAGGGNSPTRASVTPLLGPVNTFEAAMKRIDAWQEPLSLHLDRESEKIEISTWEMPEEAEVFEDDVPEEFAELSLTGTALFGPSKYALIEGKRLQEGQRIGRYVVKEIRAREVVLSENDKTHILRMAEPKLRISTKTKNKLGGN